MLCNLSVRNYLLLNRVDLDFGHGLNVLTGETGAGKSILLDALGIVLGRHATTTRPPEHGEPSEITALFDVSGNRAVQQILDDLEFPGGEELCLRKLIPVSGRASSFVNDRRCSAETLNRLGDALVEIHGQSDERGLLNPANHRRLLDQYAGSEQFVENTRKAWRDWRSAIGLHDEANRRLAEASRDREFAEHALKELEELDPKVGEDEELDRRRSALKLFAKYREDLDKAELSIGDSGAEGMVNDALSRLATASGVDEDRIQQAVEALDRALLELAEANRLLADIRYGSTGDPQEVEQVEERLFAIRAMARKHSVRPDDLVDLSVKLAGDIEDLDRLSGEADSLQARIQQAQENYAASAAEVSARRSEAASRLAAAMAEEVAPLKLKSAVFSVNIGQQEPGPEGHDRVVFNASTNPSAPAGPINAIASGGELSRFMLALKACLMSDSGATCAIFDEIDRGIGGATANAVGRRLRSLASSSQVIVVTHSPQVASLGHHHWRIDKSADSGRAETRAVKLDGAERNNEIARMLAGESITDEARAAAAALLQAV